MNSQHRDNSIYANCTFLHTGKETITFQVVEPINIELTGDQLMKEFSFVAVTEDLDRQVKCAFKLLIQSFHKEIQKGSRVLCLGRMESSRV